MAPYEMVDPARWRDVGIDMPLFDCSHLRPYQIKGNPG
jgi:hypothetical protein